MEKITDILERKTPNFHTIQPTHTVKDAISKMSCENVDYLIVLDEDDQFVGLLSEHELITPFLPSQKAVDSLKVIDIMNTRLPMATANSSVEQCMQMLKQHHSKYLAIFDDFSFCGIVSADDIINEAVSNRMDIFDAEPPNTIILG